MFFNNFVSQGCIVILHFNTEGKALEAFFNIFALINIKDVASGKNILFHTAFDNALYFFTGNIFINNKRQITADFRKLRKFFVNRRNFLNDCNKLVKINFSIYLSKSDEFVQGIRLSKEFCQGLQLQHSYKGEEQYVNLSNPTYPVECI